MGGTADVTARLIAEKLRGSYAQTSLVDSRSGAGGRIAVDAPPADGATFLMTPISTIAIYPHVFKSLSYNPFKHLAPVSLAATFTLGLAIGPAVPAPSPACEACWTGCAQTRKWAVYGSPSAGTAPHFLGAQISQISGMALQQVPYRGSVPGISDLMGGQIPLMITALATFCRISTPQAACDRNLGGDPLALCASGADLGRIGISQHRVRRVAGFVCPGQDSSTADLGGVGAALRAGSIGEQMRTFMSVFGLEPRTSSPEELASLMRVDFERWAPIIKATGFTAE